MKAKTPLEAMISEVERLRTGNRFGLTAKADREIGDYVLLADRNWRGAPWWQRLLLLVTFWDYLTFDHLGIRWTVTEWKGQPFLIFVDEVA